MGLSLGGLSLRVRCDTEVCHRRVWVVSILTAMSRLKSLRSHITPLSRSFSSTAPAMAGLDIKSKYRMLSGYEIPILGYGVCDEELLNF